MILALAISVLLASADAGVPNAFAPTSSEHVLQDGGVASTLRGCWFDSPTCVDLARERVEAAERVRLAEQKQVKSPGQDLALAFGVGTLTGALVTIAIVLGVWAATQPTSEQ